MSPKKSHHWITLPEEKVHTPASNAKPAKKGGKAGEDKVTHKLFWGLGFIVLIVVAFAVLAPNQFSALLRGSLFDAPGASPEEISEALTPEAVLDLDEATGGLDEITPEETEELVEVVEEPVILEEEFEPVVEAEEEPVEIAVEPITEAEPIDILPVAVEPEECGDDLSCFLAHFEDCSPATANISIELFGQELRSDAELTGSEGEQCVYNVTYTKLPLGQLVGKGATCKVDKGTYSEDDFAKLYDSPQEFFDSCEGPAIDALQDLEAMVGGFDLDGFQVDIAELGDVSLSGTLDFGNLLSGAMDLKKAADEKAAQDDMVDELQKQIEALEAEREQQNQALEDLTQLVQDQLNGTRPSATTGVTSTTQIGTPPSVQPGFQPNPYRVAETPEQVLQRNLAAGGYIAPVGTPTYQPAPAPQASVVGVDRTPETGPQEALFIALLITTLAIVGYGMVRAARA